VAYGDLINHFLFSFKIYLCRSCQRIGTLVSPILVLKRCLMLLKTRPVDCKNTVVLSHIGQVLTSQDGPYLNRCHYMADVMIIRLVHCLSVDCLHTSRIYHSWSNSCHFHYRYLNVFLSG